MTHIKYSPRTVILGMILAGLFVTQTTWADQPDESFEQQSVVTDGHLSAQSGQGARDVISTANLGDNVINASGSVINGNNILSDQAFSGASGIASVIQNSGNNVIIQNSTIVNVTLQ